MIGVQIGRSTLRQQQLLTHHVPLRPRFRQQRFISSSSSPKSASEAANVTKIPGGEPTAKTIRPPLWRRLGPLTMALDGYAGSQKKRPYTTQVISALVIFLCADLSAQNMSGSEYDSTRTWRTLFIGGLAAIPQYKWLIFLSTHFNYSSRALSLAAKVLFNQFTFAIAFSSYFFGAQALLSGESIQNTIDRVIHIVPTVWTNSWKVWPLSTAITLTFIPLEFRAVFTGVVAIGWQTYLSWMNRRAELVEEGVEIKSPVEVLENKIHGAHVAVTAA